MRRRPASSAGSDTGAFQRALEHGALGALGASYAFGLATSLTPCVYPMIAITVSVFGAKEAKSRVQGMLLLAHLRPRHRLPLHADGRALGSLRARASAARSANPWVVGAIAIVFLSLAASLFGAFELALPANLNNRLSSVGGTGYRGAFLLGLVCGLVAAPCVGPFLFGLLGWIATTRNVALGTSAMAFYGLGLGTLFFLVGAFAVNLPKAGAWMMGIKWVGGVALSYMALAYIRDALPRETVHRLAHPGTAYGVVAMVVLGSGLVMAGIHVAGERRKSSLAHLSKPMKLASILPAVLGSLMLVTWWQLPANGATEGGRTATGDAPALRWGSSETAAVQRVASERKLFFAPRRLRGELVRGVQGARREDVPRLPRSGGGGPLRCPPRGCYR